jgi:hypothetical protein
LTTLALRFIEESRGSVALVLSRSTSMAAPHCTAGVEATAE